MWHFNNTLLQNKDFCSTIKYLISLLTTKQDNYSSLSDLWEYTKNKIKETARSFSKNSTTQEILEYPDLKRDCKTFISKKISNLK